MKTCTKCLLDKPLDAFNKDSRSKTRLCSHCKSCAKEYQAQWYAAHPEKREENKRHYWENREARLAHNRAYHNEHRIEVTERRRRARAKHPERQMLYAAKSRAKRAGLRFSLTADDIKIPKRCPVLGVKFRFSIGCAHPSSPSLDRIIPELGYVVGNVEVISYRANVIKNNATAEELMKVADYYKRKAR